jgi:outer membrane murein-binding lipoprotein Lpp
MFSLFNKQNRLESDIKELAKEKEWLENDRKKLKREVSDLQQKVDTLASKKKIEEEEIKHMVKILNEKREIEFQKKEMQIKIDANLELTQIKGNYQDRLEELLKGQIKDGKEMYAQILKRLPDMSVRLKGDV